MEINTIIVIDILRSFSGHITHKELGDLLMLDSHTVNRLVNGNYNRGKKPHWPDAWPTYYPIEEYVEEKKHFVEQLVWAFGYRYAEFLKADLVAAKKAIIGKLIEYEVCSNEIAHIEEMTEFKLIAEYLVNCAQTNYANQRSRKKTIELFAQGAQTQIPTIAWCPLKNRAQARLDKAYFHGREELIADIGERLEQHRNSPVFLWGVGGIGKTALACHFAVYEAKQYQVFFTTYSNSFKETIAKLELRNSDGGSITSSDMTVDQRYEIHMQALRRCTADTVLIIDNADSGTDLTSQDEYSELCLLDMQFIITTRNDMSGDGRALYVGEMSEDECISLFNTYYNIDDKENVVVRKIVKVLERHTLSIELVAKTLEESVGGLAPESMLVSLQQAHIDKDDWEPVRREYGLDKKARKIVEHINIAFRVSSLSDEEKHILGSFAIANGAFQYQELRKFWTRTQIGVIKKLCCKGWLTKGGGMFRLHPVIRYVVLIHLNECFTWAQNCDFVCNMLLQITRRRVPAYSERQVNIALTIINFSDKTDIPKAYMVLLYSVVVDFTLLDYPIIPVEQLLRTYDEAENLLDSNDIGKYLMLLPLSQSCRLSAMDYEAKDHFTEAHESNKVLVNESAFTCIYSPAILDKLKSIALLCQNEALRMRYGKRSTLFLSEELGAFIQRRMSILENRSQRLEWLIERLENKRKKLIDKIWSHEQFEMEAKDEYREIALIDDFDYLYRELYLLSWMLEDREKELFYAQKVYDKCGYCDAFNNFDLYCTSKHFDLMFDSRLERQVRMDGLWDIVLSVDAEQQ